ncbi:MULTISPECIES: class I SAM-dependent methyltransferase [unclassified Desulfovibrio]|uniref:class I SAM-dependent methyltransferase n=1 Tax=unclassified Desulfovibrio TaxID=2593640 RepID=UPI000F5FE3F5|nr:MULTISPECIES: methyltransferase domain-containing protein [unclassified Desulfovibrio]RRD71859.1 methyltransferase domain-containing protein [Desulfovibrio sp. OH1209_COT-279]RRD88072.1 methyltransferase domain-containing protein [Desulfovibrio sp. OH1186_COT-070]
MTSWHEDSTGRFALNMRQKLLQHGVAAWQRRGRTLLEVNSGQGTFLRLLWECGFDVSATELCPELRRQAMEKISTRADILAAADDHLPFEHSSFDWVVLHLAAQDPEGISRSLAESLRVASAGLIVTFWNTTSLPYLAYRLGRRKKAWPAPAHSWWRVWHSMKKLAAGQMSGMSTLAAPRVTWHANCPLAFCNRGLHALPFGAWGLIRLRLGPPRSLTPLGLRLKRKTLRQPEPVMEYGKQR